MSSYSSSNEELELDKRIGWSLLPNYKYKLNVPEISSKEKLIFANLHSSIKDISMSDAKTEIIKVIEEYSEINNISLKSEELRNIEEMLVNEICHFGPLTTLVNSNDVFEEISIIGSNNPVYVYLRNQGWMQSNLCFTSEDYLKELINRLARSHGSRLTFNEPILDAGLKDKSRMNAIIEPISTQGTIATIRKFRNKVISLSDLVKSNTISEDIIALIYLVMQTDASIIISGNTGSGKTTTLNSIFYLVPTNERIIIAEETPEINIKHKHKVSLKSNKDSNIEMNDIIKSTLRMRPDRLIVGEIRHKNEAVAFVDTMLSGQGKGSYATMHGLSAKDCVQRLRNFDISNQDLDALDLIIVQRRINNFDRVSKSMVESRKIISIAEVHNLGNVNEIFSYNYNKDTWDYKEPKYIKDKIERIFKSDYNKTFLNIKKIINELYKNDEEINFDNITRNINEVI